MSEGVIQAVIGAYIGVYAYRTVHKDEDSAYRDKSIYEVTYPLAWPPHPFVRQVTET